MTNEAVAIELDDKEKRLFEEYKALERPSDKKHIFILVKDSGELIVALAEDGELRLGADMSEAAKEFWQYVQKCRPAGVQQEEHTILSLKAQCYDLMQENKALKAKIATMSARL